MVSAYGGKGFFVYKIYFRPVCKIFDKKIFFVIMAITSNFLDMKKVLLTMLMVVCASSMFAQTEEIGDSIASASDNSGVTAVTGKAISKLATKPRETSMSREDMTRLWKEFQKYAMESVNDSIAPLDEVPVFGRSKFSRRHYITQRLEISIIGGSDNDSEEGTGLHSAYKSDEDVDDAKSAGTNFNYGLNVGYSLVFVPGRIEGETLKLNRLGLGYSLGLVASFDRQDYYGTTCDFLGKLGVEAGNGHKMGIGLDFLIGTGKTAGEYSFSIQDEDGSTEDVDLPYTSWCLKYGAQLWVRSSMLNVSIKNADVRLFARYVYSKNPENEDELLNQGIICNWIEESWSFGLTFCYNF